MSRLPIEIFGQIGVPKWWDEGGVELIEISNMLKDVQSYSGIDVWIDSFGGSASEGIGIYNLLVDAAKKGKEVNPDFDVNIEVIGVAYSAASIILMAGTKRTLRRGSNIMIHNAWTWSDGNADELERAAKQLRVIDSGIADIYSFVGKNKKDHYVRLMKDETFFTAEMALEEGFATGIDEKPAVENSFKFEKGNYNKALSETLNIKRKRAQASTDEEQRLKEARKRQLELLSLESRSVELIGNFTPPTQ